MDDENERQLEQSRDRFKQRTRQAVGDALSKRLLKISNDIEALDREKRLRLVRQMIKAHQYMDGNFFGYVDNNLDWVQIDRAPDEVWYVDNQLYPYWRTALMELSRTQTEVIINPAIEGDDELEAAAKFAQVRYEANRDRTFNARLKQTENSYALLSGITFRYTFPQFSKNGARPEKVPVIENNDPNEAGEQGETGDSTESTKICSLCYRPKQTLPDIGEGTSPDKCFNCGSQMFSDYQMQSSPDRVIGYQDLPKCKNAWIVPNPAAIIVSLNASCIEETPFLKWKQVIMRAVLEERYKGLDLSSGGVSSLELKYTQSQQKATPAGNTSQTGSVGTDSFDSGYNQGSTSGSNELEEVEFHQVWLDYEIYCQWTFDDNMQLANGKTLPAGKTLGSVYPNGLWFAHDPNMVLDMWNESKNDKWTSSPYGLRAGSMYGTGSSVALVDQEALNDEERLIWANAWNNGVPLTFVDGEMITELSYDPAIPTNVKRDQSHNDFGYFTAPAMPLSAEIYGIKDRKGSDIQNKIGAMSQNGAGGLADSQKWGDTATAISIKRDLAVGRFSPELELMADQLDLPQAKQFLKNEQRYTTPEEWEALKSNHGEQAVTRFQNLDIDEDLIITIAPGTHMPKSDAQLQAKMMAFIQILPIITHSGNQDLINYASEVFGIPKDVAGWSTDRAYAGRVIQRFKALADAFIEQYGDLPSNDLAPITTPDGQQQPSPAKQVADRIDQYAHMPVDVFLDNHPAMMDAYRDWRSTDDGQDASNVLLAAVANRFALHAEAMNKQQQILNPPPPAPPVDDTAPDAGEQTKLQLANKLTEFHDRDEQRTHEQTMQDKELAGRKEIALIGAAAKAAPANADTAKAA
jgi:hypothetical protein